MGLCLYVLSRVVRDTVPEFVGPFLTVSRRSSPSLTADGNGGSDGHHLENANNSFSLRQWPPPGMDATNANLQHQHQPQPQPQHRHPRPPTPPARPRPLSFPSRFSPAAPADDTMWSSLFPPPSASTAAIREAATAASVGGGGGGGGGGGATAAVWHFAGAAGAATVQVSQVEINGGGNAQDNKPNAVQFVLSSYVSPVGDAQGVCSPNYSLCMEYLASENCFRERTFCYRKQKERE